MDCYFDLGRSDLTSIWFVQRVGFEFHVIDFYQNRLKHIDHYLKMLQQRAYLYGTFWLPHDGKAKLLGTHMSIEEQVKTAGFRTQIVPRLSELDKINAARTVFPGCYFDAKRCAEGLHALKHFQYEVRKTDPKTGAILTTSDKPKHDEHSHASDAFCYFGVASGLRTKSPACKIARPRSVMLGTLNALVPGLLGDRRDDRSGWLSR